MNKTIASFFSICLLSSAVALAGEVSSTSNAVTQKKPITETQASSNSSYTSQIATFRQMSEDYATKAHIASEKGKTELANAYKKCAEAAGNMIKNLNTGQENLLKSSEHTMQKAVANLNKLKGKSDKIVSNKKQSLNELSKSTAKSVAYYTKKAEKAKVKGDRALSKIMTNCANAKQEIYQAINTIINGNATYTSIVNENKNLGISIDKMQSNKLGTLLRTKALMLQKNAVAISQKANQARIKGNAELANCYSRMATARQQMAYGYVSYMQGKKDFQNARAELRSYSSSVNAGLVNPKQKKKNLISSEIDVNKASTEQAQKQQAPQTTASNAGATAETSQMNSPQTNLGNQLKAQMPQELNASSLNNQSLGQPQIPENENMAKEAYSEVNSSEQMNKAGNQLSSKLPGQLAPEPTANEAYDTLNHPELQQPVGGIGGVNEVNSSEQMNKAGNQLSSKLPGQLTPEPTPSEAYDSLNHPELQQPVGGIEGVNQDKTLDHEQKKLDMGDMGDSSINNSMKQSSNTQIGATTQNQRQQTMNTQQKESQAIQGNDITSPGAVSQVAQQPVEVQSTDKKNLNAAMISSPAAKAKQVKTNTADTGLPQ
ncbi:MAG: hypothetical protein GY756_21730 [bacterium]|nr:hypothetical protein [bacterium]